MGIIVGIPIVFLINGIKNIITFCLNIKAKLESFNRNMMSYNHNNSKNSNTDNDTIIPCFKDTDPVRKCKNTKGSCIDELDRKISQRCVGYEPHQQPEINFCIDGGDTSMISRKKFYDPDDLNKNDYRSQFSIKPTKLNLAKPGLCLEEKQESAIPHEKEEDWFKTTEIIDVKNPNLINIYRPISANTIGSMHKNASHDLRGDGDIMCPKFVISPWSQSSIEPDRSMNNRIY